MLKNLVSFLFFLLVTGHAVAQEPAFSWGIALPKAAKQQAITIFGAGKGDYYVVSKQPGGAGSFGYEYQLEAFKPNHDRIFSKTITPASMYDVAGVANINQKVVLFSYAFSKEQLKDILYATEYNKDGSAGAAKEVVSNTAERMSSRGRYRMVQSPDNKYTLISYEPDWHKGENEQLQLTLLDEKLGKQWSGTQTLAYEWKRGVNNFLHVNNDGVAFILKRLVVKGEDNFYTIISYDGKKLTDQPLEPGEGKKIVAVQQTFKSNGEFVVGGYYSEDKSIRVGSTNYNGAFVYAVSSAGEKFTAKIVAPFDEKRKWMNLKYLLAQPDGYILLGERGSESSTMSTDAANAAKGERDYSYHNGEIIADAYDENGKARFNKVVKRDLDTKNDFGISGSFFAAVVNNQLKIIYNDEQYRYDGKKHTLLFGYQPLIPVLVNINITSGEMEKPLGLFNSGGVGGKNAEMRMRPEVFVKIDATNYLLRGENNELFKMGNVSFK